MIAVTTLDQHLLCEPTHLPTVLLLSGLLLFNKECCDGLTSNIDGILAKYTVQLNAYDYSRVIEKCVDMLLRMHTLNCEGIVESTLEKAWTVCGGLFADKRFPTITTVRYGTVGALERVPVLRTWVLPTCNCLPDRSETAPPIPAVKTLQARFGTCGVWLS